jgi:hypothetical protein
MVEMTVCPGCGAKTSVKRQICHVCGEVLHRRRAAPEAEDVDLVIGEGDGKSRKVREKPATPRPAAIRSVPPALAGATVVVILILAGLVIYLFAAPKQAKHRPPTAVSSSLAPGSQFAPPPVTGGRPSPVFPGPSAPSTPGQALPSFGGPGTPPPVTPRSAPTPPAPAEAARTDRQQIEQAATSAATQHAQYALRLFDAQYDTNLRSTTFVSRVRLTPQDALNVIADVTLTSGGAGGSRVAVMERLYARHYDRGIERGWMITDFADFRLSVSPPITITSQKPATTPDVSVHGMTIGPGDQFVPMSQFAAWKATFDARPVS